ncbi:indole-3-glycerol phosphate synthase TrpC [Desulfococcaceae bacterium HSG8]|nr:indole-3-glycerol phosphate synthase TrpC [Desulfococcaceae bacterium HSG8]
MAKDFLSRIVEQKKEEVEDARKRFPEKQLKEESGRPRTRRPFLKQLERPGVNIIAEIKRASPSKGVICADLNPVTYASAYQQGGAAALSVLTDHPYFQGSPEDLKAAREAVNLPVLRKDFIISSYQIYESCVLGADAVLLIVRILSMEQLIDYLDICSELQLDALVETHSEEEIEKANLAGARLVGINNRNLSSFETNIENAVNMASLLDSDQVAVAESGIRGREDIEKLKSAGIHNFLIGESLVRASDPKAFLNSLIG